MRSMVTGVAGFIGSHLAQALLDAGTTVVGVDCLTDTYAGGQKLLNLEPVRDFDAFELHRLDLAEDDLTGVIDGCDVIFHLAGEPGVRNSWGPNFDAYLRNNVLATQRLLQAPSRGPRSAR